MNPKASFGNFIASSLRVLYPPLRGIAKSADRWIQLTNSAVLRTRNWSFTIKLTVFIDRLLLRPLFFVFSVAYLVLAMNLPVSIYTGAVHDSALYWGNAFQIVSGNWLGAYNQMTLAKGPGFPLFLAANAVLGIPVTLLIALLYLFACWLIANTLRALGLNKYLVLIIFVVILFHPALFPTSIIRDNIYPALSLIIISGMIRLVFAPQQYDRRLVSVVPYGLVFGFFWITREEGIWIVPGLLILLFLKAFQLKKNNLPIKDIFYRFACFLLVATIFVSLIALINYHRYGKFEAVDFKGKAFSQALKRLNSVDVGSDLPYVPVSFVKRQEIYKVSPTFSQLKDYFEDKGKGWTSFGCKIYPWTCGDYAGGWFIWALRDAAASKGYYESPMRAAEFYNNITKEIETACDVGVIKCRSNPIPFMPNVTMTQLKELPGKTVHALKLAMVQLPVPATGGPSWDPLEQLQRTRLFLGSPRTTLAPNEQRINLSGWYYSTNREWIVLNCSMNGTKIKRGVDRISSPDIAEHFKDPNANFQRFSINVPSNQDCSISTVSSPVTNLPIKAVLENQGTVLKIGKNGTLYVDRILHTNNYPAQDLFLKLKNSLATLYKFIIPLLVILGAFIYFIYPIFTWIGKAPITDIFIVSTMLWCLFFSRIFLIVLVDISSFPAISVLYMSAGFPILCLAAFLSLQLISGIKIKRLSL
jgi:hypothetical protein